MSLFNVTRLHGRSYVIKREKRVVLELDVLWFGGVIPVDVEDLREMLWDVVEGSRYPWVRLD